MTEVVGPGRAWWGEQRRRDRDGEIWASGRLSSVSLAHGRCMIETLTLRWGFTGEVGFVTLICG